MIIEILSYYISQGLDKQILKKLPYSFAISLFTYVLLNMYWPFDLTGLLVPLILASLAIFVLSTVHFTKIVNAPLTELFSYDVRHLLKKMHSIFQEQISILDDLNSRLSKGFILSSLASGSSLLVLLVIVQLLLFHEWRITSGLATSLLAITAIYLFYDVIRAPLFEEEQNSSRFPFAFDLVEAYTVRNAIARLPLKSKTLFYILSRLVGPVVHIAAPKLTFDSLFVYYNDDLIELLKKLMQNNTRRKFILKHETGEEPGTFFIDELSRTEKMTALVEQSPRRVFPYLLDPEYVGQGKGWTSLSVREVSSQRILGYIFVHRFKGVLLKRIIKQRNVRYKYITGLALLFFLIGERNYLQYIKNLIEINSVKVPPNVLNIELEL